LIKKISDKNKKDWDNFLSNDEIMPDKDSDQKEKLKRKNMSFDLHGFSLDDANKKIEELINYSYNNGIRKLTIVTGKGIHSQNEKDPYVSKDLGILKYSVPEYIKNNNYLMNMINEIEDANIEDGGSGAFYILLKKNFKE
tara:strand:- start:116 stop:535 length:420 start_codon:yes stop_codon:yes gene_type:complete